MKPLFKTSPESPKSDFHLDHPNSGPAGEPSPQHVTISIPKHEPSFPDVQTDYPHSDAPSANNRKFPIDLDSKVKQTEVK